MAEDSAYAEQFREAIENFWLVRAEQGVRAGQHLDKLAELVGDIFVDEGFAAVPDTVQTDDSCYCESTRRGMP